MIERENAGVIEPCDSEVERDKFVNRAELRERRLTERLEERRKNRRAEEEDEENEEHLREVDRKIEKERALVKRAEVLIGEGYFSKASHLLRSTDECQQVSQELADKMQVKFPKRREHSKVITPVSPDSELYITELGDFIKDVKESINGSVGGRSGLRGDHLKPLVSNIEVMGALLRVMTLLIDGKFPRWAHPYLFSRRLLALGAKARPICISEWVVRLAGFLVNRSVGEEQANAFFLHEDEGNVVLSVGAKVKGGAEVMVHAVDSLVHDARKMRAVFASDGKNAYNSVDRVYSCNTTIDTFPSTHRWIEYSYGTATLGLLLEGDGERFTIAEEEGVWQGDSMAGLIHDTAFHTTLIAASKKAADERVGKPNEGERTHIIAYRDDPFITGDPLTAARLHQLVCETRREMLGVEAAPSKFQAYLPKEFPEYVCEEGKYNDLSRAVEDMTGIKVSDEGIEVLRAPVGTNEFVDAFLNKKMNDYAIVLPRVQLMDPRCAVPFLRLTFLPIPTYLSRIIKPPLFKDFALLHDFYIRETYNIVMNDDVKSDNTRFTAPLSAGGMGFRSLESISSVAYLSSVANAGRILKGVDMDMQGAMEHIIEHPPPKPPPEDAPPPDTPPQPYDFTPHASFTVGFPRRISLAWHYANKNTFITYPTKEFHPSIAHLMQQMSYNTFTAKKMQSLLTKAFELVKETAIRAKMSKQQVARTRAQSSSGARCLYIDAPIAFPSLSISAFKTAAHSRTNTLITTDRPCACGKGVTSFEHIFLCRSMRFQKIRHDAIVEGLRSMAAQAGFVVRKEILCVAGTQKRMDVIIYAGMQTFWIDVTVVNPLAASYLMDKDGGLKSREKQKSSKWKGYASRQMSNTTFMPFAITTTGGLGEAAEAILDMIAAKAQSTFPYGIGGNPQKWRDAHRVGSIKFLSRMMAHLIEGSIEEAAVRAQGQDISQRTMDGVTRMTQMQRAM